MSCRRENFGGVNSPQHTNALGARYGEYSSENNAVNRVDQVACYKNLGSINSRSAGQVGANVSPLALRAAQTSIVPNFGPIAAVGRPNTGCGSYYSIESAYPSFGNQCNSYKAQPCGGGGGSQPTNLQCSQNVASMGCQAACCRGPNGQLLQGCKLPSSSACSANQCQTLCGGGSSPAVHNLPVHR